MDIEKSFFDIEKSFFDSILIIRIFDIDKYWIKSLLALHIFADTVATAETADTTYDAGVNAIAADTAATAAAVTTCHNCMCRRHPSTTQKFELYIPVSTGWNIND